MKVELMDDDFVVTFLEKIIFDIKNNKIEVVEVACKPGIKTTSLDGFVVDFSYTNVSTYTIVCRNLLHE